MSVIRVGFIGIGNLAIPDNFTNYRLVTPHESKLIPDR